MLKKKKKHYQATLKFLKFGQMGGCRWLVHHLQHSNLPTQTRWFFLSGNYNYKNISLVKKKTHIKTHLDAHWLF